MLIIEGRAGIEPVAITLSNRSNQLNYRPINQSYFPFNFTVLKIEKLLYKNCHNIDL